MNGCLGSRRVNAFAWARTMPADQTGVPAASGFALGISAPGGGGVGGGGAVGGGAPDHHPLNHRD